MNAMPMAGLRSRERAPAEDEGVGLGRDYLLLRGQLEEVGNRLQDSEGAGNDRPEPSLHPGRGLPFQPFEEEGEPDEERQAGEQEELGELDGGQPRLPR